MPPAEDDGRGQHKIALGRAIFARRRPLGTVDLVENLLARGQIGGAGIGQRQPARRARHELRPDMRLQFGDLPARGWHGHAKLAAGGGQAAALDGFDQHRHGFKPIDSIFPRIGRVPFKHTRLCGKPKRLLTPLD